MTDPNGVLNPGLMPQVLDDLRTRYAVTNPFRFIMYSQLEGRGLPPVEVPDAVKP